MAAMAANMPLEKFVFISSLAAMGPISFDAPGGIVENSLQSPVTNYGRSKKLAEQYLKEVEGLPLMAFRPTAVYGPREKDIFIMFKTLKNRFEPYIGAQPQRLSFIYVKDLAEVVVRGMQQPGKYNTYNVSDGNSYTRYELAAITKAFLNIRTLKVHLPLPIVQVIVKGLERIYARRKGVPTLNYEKLEELKAPNWDCSIELIKKELGFTPRYGLNAGIKETLEWYKANRWL
jgi:nucleoside-diphosphate-sugar epimerase